MKAVYLPTFQLISLQTVIERVENGINSINDIWKIFSSTTTNSTTNIPSLSTHQYEIPYSTTSQAVGQLRNHLSHFSIDQKLCHEKLSNQILKALEATKSHFYFQVEQQKLLIRNASKHVISTQDGLDKSKRQMRKAAEDMSSANEKLLNLSIMADDTLKCHSDKHDRSTNEKESKCTFCNLSIFILSFCTLLRITYLLVPDERSGLGSFSMNRILMGAFDSTPGYQQYLLCYFINN
jgi:hypothetical protein